MAVTNCKFLNYAKWSLTVSLQVFSSILYTQWHLFDEVNGTGQQKSLKKGWRELRSLMTCVAICNHYSPLLLHHNIFYMKTYTPAAATCIVRGEPQEVQIGMGKYKIGKKGNFFSQHNNIILYSFQLPVSEGQHILCKTWLQCDIVFYSLYSKFYFNLPVKN